MFQTILVPLDGSTRAEQALPLAARLARISGGSIVLLRVVRSAVDYAWSAMPSPAMMEEAMDAEISKAKEYLTTITHLALLQGMVTKTEVLPGAAARSILAVARGSQANLLVMCRHGQTGVKPSMLGSVSQQVARHSPVPVFLLREGAGGPTLLHPQGPRPVRVLLTLDGSPFAEAALAPAASLSAALSAPAQGQLHLALVLPLPTHVRAASPEADKGISDAQEYLKRMEQRCSEGELAGLNLQVTSSVSIESDIAAALISLAEDGAEGEQGEQVERCDVIAMATHGRGALKRWVLGSVTQRVLGATRLPLLIVRPEKTAPTDEAGGQAAAAKGSRPESEQTWIGLL